MQFNPSKWSLKQKFISLFLFVLLIPLVTIFLLKEIEHFLVDNLKQNLLLTSKIVSQQLEKNEKWFVESRLPESEDFIAKELFVFPLQRPADLDGFFDEWEFLEKFTQEFRVLDSTNDSDVMKLLMAADENHLYLSMAFIDQQVIYNKPDSKFRSDLIVINFIDNNNLPQRIFIAPSAPGEIPVKNRVDGELKIDWRYKAVWTDTANGFNIELKFPATLKPSQLQIRYYDVDDSELTTHNKIIATSLLDLNPVVWPSSRLSRFIEKLNVISGQRVWVLDTQGRVLARKGNLNSPSHEKLQTNSFFRWLFGAKADSVVDIRNKKLRLSSPIIKQALSQVPAAEIETSAKSDFSLALAATPIVNQQGVLGVVLIEENVARVQLLQKQTLSNLLYAMMAVIIFVVVIVGWYASKLVNRISILQNNVSLMVDEQGRMLKPFKITEKKGDEVDALNTAFQKMSNKLFDYNDYLEKLASRLSHELRTPIAIVRSSLDNLLLSHREKQDTETIQRALAGTERLGEIITRMRQASSVKDAMQSAQFVELDLNELIKNIIDGFNQSFSEHQFQFLPFEETIEHKISPDLIAELVDKLLSNAMDFTQPEKAIEIKTFKNKNEFGFSVSNKGPLIEKSQLKKIFHSLVSIRDLKNSEAPNLGLGLYVVKLIAEFHGAKAIAQNQADKSGVIFSVVWKKNI